MEDTNFGPLQHYLGYQIRQTQSAIFRDFDALMAGLKVAPGEFGLLTLIHANPGITQGRLATIYGLDKSTLSQVVSRLVERGLVTRRRGNGDQRYYGLWIEEAGNAVLGQVTLQVEAQERKMDAVLRPGERQLMLDLLQRIAQAIRSAER